MKLQASEGMKDITAAVNNKTKVAIALWTILMYSIRNGTLVKSIRSVGIS